MAVREQVVPSAQAKAATTPKPRTNWGAIGRYIAVIVVVFIALAPFYWTAITSVKIDAEINGPPTLFPHSFTTNNYVQAFLSVQPAFAKDLLNSTIVAICTTILALTFGSICAYAIARTKFRGKAGVLAIILSVQMFPLIALVGPLFVFFTSPGFDVYNTYVALIIPYLVIALPVTVYFLTSFFRDLPPDLEEAALVDGTTRLGALWRIILPLTAPGVFTTAILSFITVWNDFLFGLTLTEDSNAQTVTVAIPLFNGEHQIAFGEVAAAAIIVTIPLVIMVLFLQRRIVSGLTAGAVKG
jgi:multiple sugar transport system permease protein